MPCAWRQLIKYQKSLQRALLVFLLNYVRGQNFDLCGTQLMNPDTACRLNHRSPIELIENNATSKNVHSHSHSLGQIFGLKTDLENCILSQNLLPIEQKPFHNPWPGCFLFASFMLCVSFAICPFFWPPHEIL